MDFLVGIHTNDYRGTYNIQGKLIFVITGIKVLTLPEMTFHDIMFEDYNDYSNEELYRLLDSINGWKYSNHIYREKDILYLNYEYCNFINLGGVSLFNLIDCIPLFCDDKLVDRDTNKLKITQSINITLLDITIYVNLTSYEVGVFVGGHCIFGGIEFKSLYYDYEKYSNLTDKSRDSYSKSFLEIYLGNSPYFIYDIVPVDCVDNALLVIGSKCLLDIDTKHNGKTIIIPNEVKELILSINENRLKTEAIIVFPPSINRLYLTRDQIFSYSNINIKLIFDKESNINNILYYLYRCVYHIPKDLKDIVEKHKTEIDLSNRDRILDYIKNNKDTMVSLLGRLGLIISFYR